MRKSPHVIVALGAWLLTVSPAAALSTAFTYQGQLNQAGTPITGTCDLQFSLFSTLSGPSQFGSTQSVNSVSVSNGLFTVQLNGGGEFYNQAFNGVDRFLETAVRCPAGSGGYTTLTPRQQLTATPYALYAGSVKDFATGTGSGNTAIGADALSRIEGSLLGSGNTAVGAVALAITQFGSNNTAVGNWALSSNNGYADLPSLSSENTAVGSGAMSANITGSENTATGYQALSYNTTGVKNTALGHSALLNSTGDFNTAVGALALTSNIDGVQNVAVGDNTNRTSQHASGNVAVGSQALRDATVGANTAVGAYALQFDTTGDSNTAVGWSALIGNSGANNTALGRDALRNNTAGSNNIAVGRNAGFYITGSYNIDIGNVGLAGETDTIRIGAGQAATYIAGISGVTSSGGVAVYINGSNQLGITTSSARFKDDIRDMGAASGGLMQLRPVRFRYKKDIDPSGLEQYGLVAEEVAKIYPDLVTYDNAGRPQAVRYHFVNAMLLNEVQKQHRQLQAQTEEIRDLKAQQRQLQAQAEEISDLKARLAALESVRSARASR